MALKAAQNGEKRFAEALNSGDGDKKNAILEARSVLLNEYFDSRKKGDVARQVHLEAEIEGFLGVDMQRRGFSVNSVSHVAVPSGALRLEMERQSGLQKDSKWIVVTMDLRDQKGAHDLPKCSYLVTAKEIVPVMDFSTLQETLCTAGAITKQRVNRFLQENEKNRVSCSTVRLE